MAEDIVVFYREKYTEDRQVLARPQPAFMAAILGATRKVGPLTFKRVGSKAVGITLPSGRTLFYRNLRQEAEKSPGGQIRKVWKHGNGQRIYGGLLAENVTQAVSRDILAEAIYAAEAAGYPVVLHIHDEVVPRVPEVQGQAALDFLIKALSTPPEWGKGLVLGAEGHVSKTLSK
jgi:DNA polymerase